jgi:hypothetical protein
MRPNIPPFSTSLRRALALVLLVGCDQGPPRIDGGAAACAIGCDAPTDDATIATAGKHSPNEPDDLADGGADAATDATVDPHAPPGDAEGRADGAPDVVVGLPPDAATSPPDVALVVPPDAAAPPDVTLVLPPDAAVLPPDAAVLPPDAAVLPPDAMVLPPDAMVLPPDMGGGCPAPGGGPVMVRADLAAQPFCIDATEVTNVQYAAFLAATGNGTQTGGQPSVCSWNASYLPGSGDLAWPYASGKENRPVVNVDWCDARAFCKWSGKRLCGGVGGGALASATSAGDPASSQWANACSLAGQRSYPYGSLWDGKACNTAAPAEKAQYIADVMHFPGCNGGYSGVFDMTGNVEEWVDACDKSTGGSDLCASAGASAYEAGLAPADVTCTESVYGTPRNTQYVFLGFRCCTDL